jgi:hypothetical protein
MLPVLVVLRFPRSRVHVCRHPNNSKRARSVWNDKRHGSLTERDVTRATEIKIEPDKHRLMHIHAPTLYKRRCQHRPVTDTECTTHTASHTYTSASSSRMRRHAGTQARRYNDT